MKWGRYNPDEVKLYQKNATGLSTALIVGSHIGALAFQLEACFDELVCIEANPITHDLLRKNILMRGLSDKMRCLNIAISDRASFIPFLCNTENSGGSKIAPAFSDVDYTYDRPESLMIQAACLDTLYANRTFDFILMDIEGGEINAISGGYQLIKRSSVFVVEYVPNHIKRVANKSIAEFADALLELRFDCVEFPSLGIKGAPHECLLPSLIEIDRVGGYEDGIMFTRT